MSQKLCIFFLYFLLFSLTLISLINLIILSYFGEQTFAQNIIVITTTFASGFIINLGTIIQIIFIFVNKKTNVQKSYTMCLVFGCLILLISQIHNCVHNYFVSGNVLVLDFATPITTLMSLFFTSTFFALIWYRSRRNVGKKIEIVIVDGTACLGKTTSCHKTFDFVNYISQSNLYVDKSSKPYIQNLYESNIYADLILSIQEELNNSEKCDQTIVRKIFDRGPFSQLAYTILFSLDGQHLNVFEFANKFELLIEQIEQEIFKTFNKWPKLLSQLFPGVSIKWMWYGSSNTLATSNRMEKRGGLECNRGWNLRNYTVNQNYVFRRLCEITRIGKYREVELLDTNDFYE